MKRGEGSTPAVLCGEVVIAVAVAVAAGRRTGGAGRRGEQRRSVDPGPLYYSNCKTAPRGGS
jgi:hypothetical protein